MSATYPHVEALQRFLPQTDPESAWLVAYEDAAARYDTIKWPVYVAGALLCVALWLGIQFGIAGVFGLRRITLNSSLLIFGAAYDALIVRVAMWFTPWFPWPPWFREFSELREALKPFHRVVHGEPEQ